jgi:Exonuclease
MTPIAFIDFEAPALSFHVRPIEVGIAIWRLGESIRTWSSLIQRDSNDPWSDQSEAIHKITREDLEGAPPSNRVAVALNSLLAPIGSAFCDGMPFDEVWCRILFHDADLKREFALLPMEMLPLQDGPRMVKWLKSNKDVPHRAGADALRLMRAYAYSLKQRPAIEKIVSPV